MPCIAGIWSDSGLMIEVGVLPHGEKPKSSLRLYKGLIDTGASRTCISHRLVALHRFAPTGDATMAHAWGKNHAHTYLFLATLWRTVIRLNTCITRKLACKRRKEKRWLVILLFVWRVLKSAQQHCKIEKKEENIKKIKINIYTTSNRYCWRYLKNILALTKVTIHRPPAVRNYL